MAISESLLLQKLSGHLGKEIVFKQYGDKTVVTKYPDEAKAILANEALRNAAQVRLNTTRNRLYPALIKEYFKNVLAKTKAAAGTDGNDPAPERLPL